MEDKMKTLSEKMMVGSPTGVKYYLEGDVKEFIKEIKSEIWVKAIHEMKGALHAKSYNDIISELAGEKLK